ncbi:MAG TPA: COQ9 family protein [Rhizomicrobium sp.]|nr:COQ9 family protein [Rhizomicrobium sp.]
MTGAKTTKRRKGADDDASLRRAVAQAALAHIPFDGFTDKVLNAAASDAGVDKRGVARLFPGGPLDLVEALSDMFDDEMEARLAKAKLGAMKVRARIAKAVKTRLEILKPHKEAARRAAAFLTLPPHAARGAALLYRTVDVMWRAAGDTSTDFNFYTKRAILAGVYSATLMRWFTDESEDESETDAFLARRIDDVMRFEKFKAQIRERAKHLPSLSDIFGGGPSAKRS